MAFRTFDELLKDTRYRLRLLERRLATGGGTSGPGFVLPPRLSDVGQEVTDWNLAIDAGFYWSAVGALNAPGADNYVGHVLHHAGLDRDVQELWLPSGGTTVQRTWRRTRTTATNWGAWTEVDRMATAADVGELGTTADLNNVLETGWYVQVANANATPALNYPVARAGHLEVSHSSSGSDFTLQTYTEYAPGTAGRPSRQYRRSRYGTTWYPWELVGGEALARPAPIRYAGATHTVAATAWGTLLPGWTAQTMTVEKPLWVLVTIGAWLIASAGETRAGLALSGATVLSPPSDTQQSGTASSWGQTLMTAATDSSTASAQKSIQRLILLGVGTTTFRLEAYLVTAGTHAVNYPVLEVVPLYYDGT